MAFNCVSLLVLLLAFCLVPTIARNLDISQRSYDVDAKREISYPEEDTSAGLLVSKKQGPISSFAHAKGVFISSVLSHETGHEDNTFTHGHEENQFTHETGNTENPFLHKPPHEENIIIKSALHPKPELRLHDKVMSLPSLSHEEEDTIPSLLYQNGLPIGLLPSSVASYSVTDDGEFTVSLQKACYVKFDYEVYYAPTITGKLSYGTITDLSGIQAKEAFFWVPVTGIRTDIPSSEYIYFDVGPISKKLSISQFQTTPVCKVKAMAFSALA